MKSTRRFYLMAVLGLTALFAGGCAWLPSHHSAAQARAADRVVSAYHVADLLEQAAPAVSESLDKNLPKGVGVTDRQRLNVAVSNAYVADDLRADTVDRLKQQAADDDRGTQLAKAAEHLDSPLARRMIALEDKVAQPGFADGFHDFVNQPAGPKRKQRLKLINQLAGDMQVTNLQTDFNVTLLGAMIRARNAAVGPDDQVGEAQIQRILSKTRQGIRSKLEQQVPLMLLYVYRGVDADTLQQYADLQSTPELVWANRALEQSVVASLAAAGKQIPDQYNAKGQ